MMGEQENPADTIDYTIPQVTSPVAGWSAHDLYDYFGVRTRQELTHSNLPGRAYNLIWNEWFRSEDLQDSVVVDKDNGPDDEADYVLLKRNKRHDYMTSALPWPQKGTAQALPLGTSAPVVSVGDGIPEWSGVGVSAGPLEAQTGGGQTIRHQNAVSSLSELVWDDTKLETDLSSATAATVNQLRQAFQLQKLMERDARGGTRYSELTRSHFGVISPDARLQRPEFLGGHTQRFNTTPVAATAELAVNIGDLAGFATSIGQSARWTRSFTEHGHVIGLINIRAQLSYQQGLPRMLTRESREEYYFPTLAHLGEQIIRNDEIFAQGTSADTDAFGYQERWAEYRYKPSQVTGMFRSDHTLPLDNWHLSIDFASLPVLNSSFLEEAPPFDRITAESEQTEFLFDAWFDYKHVRPMPTYSVPGLIDHF